MAWALLSLCLAATWKELQAQRVQPIALSVYSNASASVAHDDVNSVASIQAPVSNARAPWWAPLASLLVPGSGQFAMGQQRSVAYLVADGYLVLQAMSAKRDVSRDRDDYRALASDVARRPFSATRPSGVWDYYEDMEKYLESGVYSKEANRLVPETDESTFNGASWLLARETFWRDPDSAPADTSAEYQRALAFYAKRAITPEYRWSWRDAQLQQDVYKQTIASANRSEKRKTNLVSLIGANHLVSMIDAYVSVRVRRYGGVRVAGYQLDGVHTTLVPLGDPADGKHEWRASLRMVPTERSNR
jgi:hypothetical protein